MTPWGYSGYSSGSWFEMLELQIQWHMMFEVATTCEIFSHCKVSGSPAAGCLKSPVLSSKLQIFSGDDNIGDKPYFYGLSVSY